MKNKIIKCSYIIVLIISILVFLFLIIKPCHKEVEYAEYDTTNKISISSFGSVVEEKIFVDNENTFRIMFFLKENTEYDNLNISLVDESGNEIFNQSVNEYKADAMYFEFAPIEVNTYYILKIIDEDGDNLELATTNSSDNDYLLDDENSMLQTVTYYRAPAYNYLWYPIFLFAILFTLFPFIWEDDKNEEK